MDKPTGPERLRDIGQQIKAARGQFIIMALHSIDRRPGPGGCFAPDVIERRRELLALGLLDKNPSKFDLASASSLPTQRFTSDEFWSNEPVSQDGAWQPGRFLAFSLAPLLTHEMEYRDGFSHSLYPNEHELDLIVGDEAVYEWAEGRSAIDPEYVPFGTSWHRRIWLQLRAEVLGWPLTSASELKVQRDGKLKQMFTEMLKLEAKIYQTQRLLEHESSRMHPRPGRIQAAGELALAKIQLGRLIDQAEELGLGGHAYIQMLTSRDLVSAS